VPQTEDGKTKQDIEGFKEALDGAIQTMRLLAMLVGLAPAVIDYIDKNSFKESLASLERILALEDKFTLDEMRAEYLESIAPLLVNLLAVETKRAEAA
jgi:hypothetical protein